MNCTTVHDAVVDVQDVLNNRTPKMLGIKISTGVQIQQNGERLLVRIACIQSAIAVSILDRSRYSTASETAISRVRMASDVFLRSFRKDLTYERVDFDSRHRSISLRCCRCDRLSSSLFLE